MPKNKSFKLIVPKTITSEALKVLAEKPSRLRYKNEEVYIVMNYMVFKQVNLERGKKFFPINRNYLKQLLDKNPMPFIRFLAKNGILEQDNSWEKGRKCMFYRLSQNLKLDCETVDLHPGSKQYERKLMYHRAKRKHYNNLEPYLKQMLKKYLNVGFDYNAALKYWRKSRCSMKKKIQHLCQIEALADKRTRTFGRNSTNYRLDTSLTNLKSDYRQFLVGDYSHIDKKNSQPYYFNQTLCKVLCVDEKMAAFSENSPVFSREKTNFNSKSIDIPVNSIPNTHTLPQSLPQPITQTIPSQHLTFPLICGVFLKYKPHETFGKRALNDIWKIPHFKAKCGINLLALKELRLFGEWVNKGMLYPKFLEQFDETKLTEKQAKKMVFGLFFSQNITINKRGKEWIPYKKEKDLFAKVFPFVAEVIKTLKIRNYKHLSVYLQRVESYIFIDCIARLLVDAGIVPLTIHDSIMVETKHEQRAVEIMQGVFGQHFNAMPTLKITYLGTGGSGIETTAEGGLESPKSRPAKILRGGSYELNPNIQRA